MVPIDIDDVVFARRTGASRARSIVVRGNREPRRREKVMAISSVRGVATLKSKLLILIGCLVGLAPAFAQDELERAPMQLFLKMPADSVGQQCSRIEPSDPAPPVTRSLHRTFHDDFDEHPLSRGWEPHYTGSVAQPESFYAAGDVSELRRKTKYNGEQQIYVDPGYEGRGMTALGLDPFRVRNGVLSIVASRTPPALKEVLFNNEYISGILTTQKSFSQKYGYFEMRAKIPLGVGVWPAFWLLANDGGWPPEIDAMEGRGQRPGAVVMTTHWRNPSTGLVEYCGFDFAVPNAWIDFHDYGVLWEQDRIVYFIDRKPVSDIKVPAGFEDPMYMIVNLAMGAKNFGGVGFVDAKSPDTVEFQIDRISAYQLDSVPNPRGEADAR
jgi:beta-glucanase (GH16 family)